MQADYLREYERFEQDHWWYVARRGIIESFLDRYVIGRSGAQSLRWLDLGCGSGVLLDSYQAIQDKMGLEADAGCVARGREKGLDVRQTGPAWDLAPLGPFDLITLCDVLEHIEDEQAALAAVHAALVPGGKVLLTVPALRSLWSSHDLVNHHFRRYRLKELTRLFDPGTWHIERATYYCSFLLPAIWMTRKLKNFRERWKQTPLTHDMKFGPPWLDGTLLRIFAAERPLLPHLRMPLGNSLILVATRR